MRYIAVTLLLAILLFDVVLGEGEKVHVFFSKCVFLEFLAAG